jgi:glutaminyl-peptide cyclotransferase
MRRVLLFAAGLAVMTAITSSGSLSLQKATRRAAPAPTFNYRVVRSYPHDREAYTQGLVYRDNVFYESTGCQPWSAERRLCLKIGSSLRKVRVETGEILQIRRLDPQYFGEGLALVGNKLIQLTWQTEVGFVYDVATFEPQRTFSYTGEGWGLTYDEKRLVMSDGSSVLRFLDPATLKETGRLTVKDAGMPVEQLNELEIVKGEIYANVYQTHRIARISPQSGQVVGWIDLTGLLSARESAGVDVLNGIAYDAAKDRLFVTGKLWPKLFEIQIVGR